MTRSNGRLGGGEGGGFGGGGRGRLIGYTFHDPIKGYFQFLHTVPFLVGTYFMVDFHRFLQYGLECIAINGIVVISIDT